jgi:predicted transcriptional regulator
MSKSTTSKERMKAAERRPKVVALRKAGYTQREIASQLGVVVSTVSKDLKFSLEEFRAATAEEIAEMRDIDNARIEEMIKGLWVKAKNGQVTSIDRMVKLLERRAKLNGLDGVVKIAPTTPDGDNPYRPMSDEEMAEALADIFKAAQGDQGEG